MRPEESWSAIISTADLWIVKDIGVSGGTGEQGVMGLSQFYETFHETPEPSTLVLLGMGAIGMAGFVRRKGRLSAGFSVGSPKSDCAVGS
jgi:hypothetical protein